ncbi:hypothetical protein KY290_035502 [Solanum tuberosum]|uniref:Uncharacterized protein n=1 Tax=Solanum tuberosum TaxID=4113 RepID=A0ABQ7U893_SOLTU|nr:hypothetical protein KY289_035021 [Solanum tuberosum]KAH0649552.1 hypothetical protein KY285_034800 [Solanum tuberosum]KAH0742459.1 hypothetical protein KY290_035502 [Solanum tuberosum]
MEPPSNQSYYGCKCLPHWPEEVKMAGVKRPYSFSPEYPPVPSFRCKKCCVAPVSRSNESTSCSNKCSVNVEEGTPQCVQLFDYVPSRVAAAEPTPPSGLSKSVQQPILGFFPSAKVQIDREGTHGSDFRTEAEGNNVDLELKL